MFNKELFEISQNAIDSANKEDCQNEKQNMEKQVLEMIKKYSYKYMDPETGKVLITTSSKNHSSDNSEYSVLNSIVTSGKQKYFEEEYSLYFYGEDHTELFTDCYDFITFVWDSFEYNMKNKPKGK